MMELKEYIRTELNNVKEGVTRVLNTLSQQEIAWRPCSGCNSIGLILFHMARVEDSTVLARLQGKSEVWESNKWYEKWKLPLSEVGAHYTVEQVNAFVVPDIKDLMGYFDTVHAKSMDYLKELTPEQLDKKINMPRTGDTPAGLVLARMVGHLNQHCGEMSYLRGLQRGMDK